MTNLINTTNINTVKVLKDYSAGRFRFITKCAAGFMTISDAREFDNEQYIKYPESLLTSYKKGAIQTIEFCPVGGDYYLTIFAKKGNRICVADETLLMSITVGTINQYWYNTNLYDQAQYLAVGAKTWADRAFVNNRSIAGIDFSTSLNALQSL